MPFRPLEVQTTPEGGFRPLDEYSIDTPATVSTVQPASQPGSRLKGFIEGANQATGGIAGSAIQNTANTYKNAIPDFIEEAGRNDESTSRNPVKRVAQNALAATGSALNTVFAPITGTVKAISDAAANNKTVQNFAQHPMVNKVLDLFGGLDQAAQEHPELARDIQNLIMVGTTALGAKTPLAEKPIGSIEGIKNTTVKVAQDIKSTVKEVKQKAVDANTARAVNKSVSAVSPELTGRKLVDAYKEVIKGKRNVTESSVFKEQQLSPSDQIIALGTRLKDVIKSTNPLNNLKSLSKELGTTESKIQQAFKSDPELQYNADKSTLFSKLEEIKSKLPREYTAIKDSRAVFNNVVDFAKELLNKADDTPLGLREARTAFDAQARLEYPNAFREGAIDLKTPAGRAIRDARDAFNQHLYNTAPNGTEIQRLIGHEADLFKANENIAAKAAKLHGDTGLKQWMKRNPGIVKAIGIVGAATLGAKVLQAGGNFVDAATGR
jgi:hypothetical protein